MRKILVMLGFVSSVLGWGIIPRVIHSAPPQAELVLQFGHSFRVNHVSWSPDGKRLASASYDKTVIIWDAQKGNKIRSLSGHSKSVESVTWSPDGKYLASASGDKTVIIWDAQKGEKVHSLNGHSYGVNSVSWSPDGKRLVSASEYVGGIIKR